jgi:hypothetical protein
MKTFTIDSENNISAFASPEEAAAGSSTPFDTFTNRQELADLIAAWPPERIVAIWNSVPGVAPVKRFKTSNVAATKIWERILDLGECAESGPILIEGSARAQRTRRSRATSGKAFVRP